MAQIAMRAGIRGTCGATVEGIRYDVNAEGLTVPPVHDVHVKAMRSLGFKPCSEENPKAPEITSLSEDDWALLQRIKNQQFADASKSAAEERATDLAKTPAKSSK